MTPHLNRLIETVQMRAHNIGFYTELTKIIAKYYQILPLIYSSQSDLNLHTWSNLSTLMLRIFKYAETIIASSAFLLFASTTFQSSFQIVADWECEFLGVWLHLHVFLPILQRWATYVTSWSFFCIRIYIFL